MGYRVPRETAASSGGAPLTNRIWKLLIVFLVVAAAWALRLVYLQVVVAGEYSEQAAASRTVSVDLSPRRGTIYDRNGKVLATSVEAKTIYANPQEIENVSDVASKLASVLGGTASDYEAPLTAEGTFAYVKRKAEVEVADKLKDMQISGLYYLDDTRRVYPYGQVGGQILGFVGVDDEGLTGLELYYDDILKGAPGKLVVQQGGEGVPIPGGVEVEEPASDGEDIILSIDIDMQAFLEQRLARGVEEIGGKNGNATLLDAATGEILATASTPYFNPSDMSVVEDGATSLKPINFQYEPGSIFKTVSAMALLEANAVTPSTEIACPASLPADEYFITDAHERPDMTMDMNQIIADSSNVGISLAVQHYLGFKPLYDKILAYGLNNVTGVDYPGEASGYLTHVDTWPLIQAYNVTFGQGVSTSPLQMTRFYGAIANGGVACTPHFLIAKPQTNETIEYETKQIIQNTDAIPAMVSMLEGVVDHGTGRTAAIEGYRVVGKTGTAEYADEETNLYVKDMYNLDFVGFVPDASTKLVCFVGVNHVPYERNTCEVFKDIMSEAIERYRVVQM